MKALSRVVDRLRRRLDAPWTKHSRGALFLIWLSCAITVVVGLLGPSTVTLNPGPARGALPPWFIPVEVGQRMGLPLSEWIVVPALWVGILVGALGLWVGHRAVGAGWRPPIHKAFWVGVGLNLATASVPPLTSADVLMYAAYGRLQQQGFDPYVITPAEIFRSTFDPVLVLTERPWQDTPSVYGPIASASQWLAAYLGGESMHAIVFWLQLMCVVPFIVVCAVMIKLAHGDALIQTRAVLFTVLNPLLIWAVVAGAHNEALTLMFAIVGLYFVRRSAFATGVCLGLAGSTKASLVFYGLALLWAYRFELRKMAAYVAGALVPLVICYGLLVPQALWAALRNAGYVSAGSWAPPVVWVFDQVADHDAVLGVASKVSWLLMAVIAWMLSRVLPWRAVPGAVLPAERDPLTIAVRTATVLCAAWVMTASWSLPWYDLIAWAPLALLAANRLDNLLLLRGAVLSVGYVTSRSVQFSPAMRNSTGVIRDNIGSGVAWLLLALVVHWWWTRSRELPTRGFVASGWRRLRRGDRAGDALA